MNIKALSQHLITKSAQQARTIVAIAGPPGAGKSSLAQQLLLALTSANVPASIVPMDGFHLDNALLKQLSLSHRKGAPNTFDSHGFVHLIKRLSANEAHVVIPTFNRQQDIAIAGSQVVNQDHKVLIVEGNYLLIKQQPWAKLAPLWDYSVFINPGITELTRRLTNRWLTHGLDEHAAKERALSNDIPNAHYVLEHSARADMVIGDEAPTKNPQLTL